MTSSIANSENISDDEITNPRKSQMDKAYYLANLAMKINDADEAVRYSDEMAILNEEPLTRDQRRVFCGCNYLYIEKLRSGLLYLNKLLITEQTGKRMINEIKDLKEKIILKRCEHVIRIINENLLTKKIEPEVMALYLKMKGDYYRYMAEISKGNLLYVNKQNAFHFYNEAKDIVKDFDDLNPTKLNISLNYSVFLNEVLNKRINSFFYAKEALYNALKSLKNCSEDELTSEDMKDTLMIIEILNRNVEDWYKEEVGDIFEDEKKAKKKEEEEKEKKKKKHKKHKEEEKEENNKDKDKDNDELIDNSYKRFKGIAAGTGESAFKFYPVPSKDGKPKRAYIFESAIDLMSFYTFCNKDKIEGAMFISMAGLKPTVPKQLEAEGVKIISCVDNDDAGRKFEADNGFTRSDSVKHLLDDKGFKDWNELLVFKSENPNANLLENGKPNIKQETNNVTYEPRRR